MASDPPEKKPGSRASRVTGSALAQPVSDSRSLPELGALPLRGARRRGHPVVRLVSTTPTANLSIELQAGTNKIGRQREDNHIVLVSPQISRFHAEIDVSPEALTLRDLGSGNGTYVNGNRVNEIPLQAGDLIAFSDKFTFRIMVDLVTDAPESLTWQGGPSPATGPTDPPVTVAEHVAAPAAQAVPESLARRTQALKRSSPELDIEALQTAPVTPPSIKVARQRPVEITAERAIPSAIAQPAQAPAEATHEAHPRVRPIPIPEAADDQPLPAGAKTTWPGMSPAQPFPPQPVTIADGLLQRGDATDRPRRQRALRPTQIEDAEPTAGPDALERERRQLEALHQVSKRCMSAESLDELDAVLVSILERTTDFDRGFVTYQLPGGEWKLVISPKGDRWERRVVRQLLQLAMRTDLPIVTSSRLDDRLGQPEPVSGSGPAESPGDFRLLLPLRLRGAAVGAIFLISGRESAFGDDIVDFLHLFADIAALAIANLGHT